MEGSGDDWRVGLLGLLGGSRASGDSASEASSVTKSVATLLRSASLLSVKLEGVIEETELLYSTTRFDSQWRGAKVVSSGASQSEDKRASRKKSKGRQQVAKQKQKQFERKDKWLRLLQKASYIAME
jgi:hypothetical protein